MKSNYLPLALVSTLSVIALSGCNQQQVREAEPQTVVLKIEQAQPVEVKTQAQKAQAAPQKTFVKKPQKPKLIKIVGIGYGSESTYEGYTPGQRRLMAIRASKLDAYRSLAEQLYGIKIDSNTTVSALMAKSDSFRARVNAVVRGARIVSVTPMADHNYETILEVYVDKSFFQQNFVYSAEASCGANGCYPEEAYQIEQVQCDARMNCSGPAAAY